MKTNACCLKVILAAGAMLLLLPGLFSCSVDPLGSEVKGPYLSFTTPSPIKPAVQGGLAKIVVKATGGELPYEFYVIPEPQWLAGDKMHDMLERNDFSRLSLYACGRNLHGSHTCIIEVQPGSTTVPRYYWVAVQDKSGNASISGTNMLTWWKRVAVSDL